MKIEKALTFDDCLLVPQYSEILPTQTETETRFSKNIKLNIPIISSPMDTVTEAKMAEAMAVLGGIGIIHKNLSIERQAEEVGKVKNSKKIGEQSVKDKQGGLLCGAAIGPGADRLERAEALAKAGVDVIVVDTAHGHSKGVIETVKELKKQAFMKNIDVVAGNVATREAVEDLIKAGADGVKIGIGPGSICTTRVVAGVGVPQITAIMEAVAGKKKDIPLIADGGIKYSGDIVKALAVGAESVMLGGLLAGTEETPGKKIKIGGEYFKSYRGMGSMGAMGQGSKDRYGQADVKEEKKFVPEGIEGVKPFKGSVADVVYQLVGGLRSGLGYNGAKNISELQKKAKLVEISAAGYKESHPHSVNISKKAPNY